LLRNVAILTGFGGSFSYKLPYLRIHFRQSASRETAALLPG
jgi:hypothetical protein